MSLTNSPIWFGSGATGGDFYPVQINDSLRFNDNDSPSLSKAYAAAQTNTKKLTISVWVKRGNLGIRSTIIFANSGSAGKLSFQTTDKIYFNAFDTGYNGFESYALFRDTSAWYHIVAQADSAGQTGANINRVWVNGVELSNNKTSVFVPNNTDTMLLRNGVTTYIGDDTAGAYHFDGYLAEMNVIDGSIVAPTEFGETKDGVWIPKSYGGSYGTNGFYLNFSNNSTATNLGLDSSGNSNNWSVNNIATTDQIIDTPTNNFATLNPLYNSISTSYPTPALSEGNLAASTSSGSNWKTVPSTMYMSTGKWYSEVRVTYTDAVDSFIGFASSEFNGQNYAPSETAFGYQFHPALGIRHNSTQLAAATFTQNDIIGLALNMDDNEIKFYKNGTLVYTATSVAAGSWSVALTLLYTKTLYANFGQDGTFAGGVSAGGNSDANGRGDFKYAVPSGFLALCTANLPEPTIIDGSENFNTVLYTGNGATGQTITTGLSPDFVWAKSRSSAYDHGLQDTVRGATKDLNSNNTQGEETRASSITSFTSTGFVLGGNDVIYNESGGSHVAWNWKAGGTAVSNTAGTITSTLSANTDSGFSIVTYTGTGTNGATVGHGLGVAPNMMIFHRRNTGGTDWIIYHSTLGATKNLAFDTAAAITSSTRFNNTAPSSTVFTLGTTVAVNGSADTYVAYCFANVDGFSKAGSYVGNGSTNGPFVYTGFRPAWLMIKRTDAAADWIIWDDKRNTYNELTEFLYPNLSIAEATGSGVADLLSNGFKLRNAGVSNRNASGGTYIYLAFAENPFKYANAR